MLWGIFFISVRLYDKFRLSTKVYISVLVPIDVRILQLSLAH